MRKTTTKASTKAKQADVQEPLAEVAAAPVVAEKEATEAAAPSEAAKETVKEEAKKPRATRKKAATTKSAGETKKSLASHKSKKKEQPKEAEVTNMEVAPADSEPAIVAEKIAEKTEEAVSADTKVAAKDEVKAETRGAAEQPAATEAPVQLQQSQEKGGAQKPSAEQPKYKQQPQQVLKFVKPTMVIHDIVELGQAPLRQIILSDQQIQQLTLEDAEERYTYLEQTLARVLDYDVVLSDTNIWLELLFGHTSSHSDPRVNARLQFERQLEFISKMTRKRKGKFMMMAETYEEIDRFATQQEPANYQDADFQDQGLCLNIAARLAKRLILSQQRENRLKIEGIGAESHHAAFADPAIIRRTVEFFAQGKKVLLITNDASVGIRSMGLCDDLQRFNGIDDERWEREYAPLRPMVATFDDLKMLDQYTRQYHFLQQAAGKEWMEGIPSGREEHSVEPLRLWMEAFRPGDRHRTPQPQMPVADAKQKQNNGQNQQNGGQKQKQNNNQKQNNQQQNQQNQQQKQNNQQKQQSQPKQDSKPEVKGQEKPMDNIQEKVAEKPADKSKEKATDKPKERPADKSKEQPAEKSKESIQEPSTPAEQPAEPASSDAKDTDMKADKGDKPKPKRRGGRRTKKAKETKE